MKTTLLSQIGTDYKIFYGYRVYKNGDVFSPTGKKLRRITVNYEDSHVLLFINGKHIKKRAATLIYMMFHDDYDPKKIVWFIDGNTKNITLNNLIQITRREYLELKNIKEQMKIFSRIESENIKKEYINSLNANLKKDSGKLMCPHLSYSKLAKKYNCSLSTIQKIINGSY